MEIYINMDAELKQVQVVLKKTKITKTILNQSISVSFKDANANEILGWCLDGKNKIVVSYNSKLNTINKSIYIKSYKVNQITKENLRMYLIDIGNDPFEIDKSDLEDNNELIGEYFINVISQNNTKRFDLKTIAEVESLTKIIDKYKSLVEERGQFYL